jgi:hypothetical protein
MTDDEFYKIGMKACEKVVKEVKSWFPHEDEDEVLSMAYEFLVRIKPNYDPAKGTVANFVYGSVRLKLIERAIVRKRTKKRIPFDLIGSIDIVSTKCGDDHLTGYDAIVDDKYDEIGRIDLQDMLTQIMVKIKDPELVDVFIMLADGFTISEIASSGLYGKSLHRRVNLARLAIYEDYGIKITRDEDDWGKGKAHMSRGVRVGKRSKLVI